jgi:cobalamin biosynthesis Mg chelatase CobN
MTWLTKSIRAFLITACVLLVAPAAAFADCGTTVIDDYLKDGTISGNYSQACYKSALKQIPTDMDIYTDVRGSINAAMNRGSGSGGTQNATAQPGTTTSKSKPKAKTTGATTTDAGTTSDELLPVAPGTTDDGLVGEALKAVGPKKADEVPMPVLILGGLAALLILAGAGGLIAQRRSRRGLEDDLPPSDGQPTATTAS